MLDWISPTSEEKVCAHPPDCGYAELINLIRVVINDIVFLSTFLVVVGCVFVGFKLMTSGGNESEMKDAKSRLGLLLKGYFFILAAWLIVYLITGTFLNSGYSLLQSINS